MNRPNAIDWFIYRIFRWWWNPILRAKPRLAAGLEFELAMYRLELHRFVDQNNKPDNDQAERPEGSGSSPG